ncbi:MAG TPA: hypothetical protein VJ022_10760 [Anaerolineales bacterium]|nr:hypothetical protein [Anaerolineales bacterium]
MTSNIVIACIDTRDPPATLRALDGLDVAIHRVVGFDDPREASLFREADAIITEMHPVSSSMMESF